jgi:NAD(P)-dependent dehydrogenase (short-subunit alcohol dehydrogenase family)
MTDTAMTLDGKRVVVIGGVSGIGFDVAKLAHALGAAVVIGSSTNSKVGAAVERLQGTTGHTVDLRDEPSVARFFRGLGAFDHLVITAGDWGASMFGSARDLDLEQARESLAVRFWGVLAAVKFGSRTIAQDGSITLTSGMLGHRPRKGAPVGHRSRRSRRTPHPRPCDGSRPFTGQCRVSRHRPDRARGADAGVRAAIDRNVFAHTPRRNSGRGR